MQLPILALLAATTTAVFAQQVSLDESTFDAFIAENKGTMVAFSTTWCHYCKILKPHYKKAGDILAKDNLKIGLAMCDLDAASLCEKQSINAYPTLYLYKNGNPTEYQGEREAQAIVDAVKALQGSDEQEEGEQEEGEQEEDEEEAETVRRPSRANRHIIS